MPIPGAKPYHFIWRGGSKPIGPGDINSFIAWHIANPEAEITLWVDETKGPAAAKIVRESLQASKSFTVKDISDAGASAEAVAASLRQAAEAGAPFCEECEKHGRAQDWMEVELAKRG